jgi:hypothetical protein
VEVAVLQFSNERLRTEHARLDREVAAVARTPAPDIGRMATLKRRKLALKDGIARRSARGQAPRPY